MPFMTIKDFRNELDYILENYGKEIKQDTLITGVSIELKENQKYPPGTIFFTCVESLPLKNSVIARNPYLNEGECAWQLAIIPKENTKWM